MPQSRRTNQVPGMILVDAYLIPAGQADAYIAAREALADKATRVLRPLHNLADHPAEARIMLILSRFA